MINNKLGCLYTKDNYFHLLYRIKLGQFALAESSLLLKKTDTGSWVSSNYTEIYRDR